MPLLEEKKKRQRRNMDRKRSFDQPSDVVTEGGRGSGGDVQSPGRNKK